MSHYVKRSIKRYCIDNNKTLYRTYARGIHKKKNKNNGNILHGILYGVYWNFEKKYLHEKFTFDFDY